jgi:pimeloyl-ACP methyl ester carboxylesterase
MPETWRDVTVDGGVRLRVRVVDDAGRGVPTLVLHHGLASSQHIWDLMLPRLARRLRVVTYDARGHGRSAKPTTGYGFPTVVADALGVIGATRSRRPIVVGHSWGAMVALELAARHPRSVAGAVFVDGGMAPVGEGRPWHEVREALAPPPLAGMPVEVFRRSMPSFWGDALAITPEIEAIVFEVMHVRRDGTIRPRLSRANHLRILRAIWEQDPLALHGRLRVPALAIAADSSGDGNEAEREHEKRDAASALRAAGAPTRLTWIRGIHDLPLQHPDELARRIERFARTAVG